jgi:hypothetical protein
MVPLTFSARFGAKVTRKHTKNNILEEIKFNRRAHESGVPSSKLIEELTALDVDASFSSSDDNGSLNGCKYHVLVSEYHRNECRWLGRC